MSGTAAGDERPARRPPIAPALSRSDLDRDYLARVTGPAELLEDPRTRVVVLHAGRALGASPERLALLAPDDLGDLDPDELVFLGRARSDGADLPAGGAVLSLVVDQERAEQLEGSWLDLRAVGSVLDPRDAGLFTQALALANWHATSAYSPVTGRSLGTAQAGWVRVDPDTGREHYPRTDPAVIVAVLDDADRILLGANVAWGENRFSLLAGFVEPGESLEAAVVREIYEEAGVVVTDPEYRGSQPWPFPASLMLGFEARIAEGTSTEPRPDGTELRELRWFTRDELTAAAASGEVTLPGPTSIARAIIDDWHGGVLADRVDW
ncbi:NAD(+) diphosphatase [Homoserinibacter sp. GY 40078]|uniref:NAD(+) diphosphatase n=1 Tax=Homoserinibacter sp. GY 40078 TaxID=2603275 RepID=UPI0011CC2E3E|nr:NAD(+) diphosphatase [Homoserinibacter sp. GY 40078]TXK19625.1 NAD(+) diphosphatase [Homoserinibacter sp. GY 40078]